MWNILKVNNKDTRTTSVSLLLILSIFYIFFSVSIADCKQVNVGWEQILAEIAYVFVHPLS